ncbi:hypothetical protein LN042_16305 [Kitasatospora sp. RB6PN24]|uniref:hypothetical protein n=1 Tax=Kitasatospora humi TaxID=2893891 RepID=UPI001E5B5444|nr:hypothetical protein [Kitasatospora humi]MCC9308627.1 hypothetical protein [Kitasatospora humi]
MVTGLPHLRSLLSFTGLNFAGLTLSGRAFGGEARDTQAVGGRRARSGTGGPVGARERALRCDTVTVPLRHGLETVDILRLRRACGSVVQGATGVVAFLVPAGTADRWQLSGTSCTPGAAPLPATDPRWLVPPAGSEPAPRLTDPWVLRAALCEAARTLTAGGIGPF